MIRGLVSVLAICAILAAVALHAGSAGGPSPGGGLLLAQDIPAAATVVAAAHTGTGQPACAAPIAAAPCLQTAILLPGLHVSLRMAAPLFVRPGDDFAPAIAAPSPAPKPPMTLA